MKNKSIIILALSVVFAIVLNIVAFVGIDFAGIKYGGMFDKEQGIRQGIDLAGGSVITFQANTDNPTPEEMAAVEQVFSTRTQNAGYSEARISKDTNGRITVEIPSVFDTDSAVSLLGSMAKLTFVNADGVEVLDGNTDIKTVNYRYGAPDPSSPVQHFVELEFYPEAREKFAQATREAAARPSGQNYIAIRMDDYVVSQPFVEREINQSSCIITNPGFTAESAHELVNQIKSGQLPFELEVITQETVGAELGADALPTAITAALIGIILVMLFMIVMYRLPGAIASISLLIYIGLIGLAMGLTHTNLSLSGIAGIVLSIGMAVDADCIIFERMKEELATGKTIRASVESGFNKAFSAILDSNVTTIISCIVLYCSGIGTVTGFATTLGIGVVLSMFTAIVITKFLLKQLVNVGIRNRKLYSKNATKNAGAKFTENRWKFTVIPAVIIVVGIVMCFVNGGFNFDVEFMGGTRMQIELNQEFDHEELAQLITDKTGASTKVQKSGSGDTQAVIKVQATEDADATKVEVLNAIKEKYSENIELIESSTASASFGGEMQTKALTYTLIAILCILVYIAIRFEWRSAIMAVIALAINVVVMAAVYTITNIPLNTTFIAAMLTVVGYSINNTIVIFDRVRENMKYRKKENSITETVDKSISETTGRTINSTITTLITIVLIYILGVSAIKEFALPLIVGIIIGAYTSIFLASTFWAVWKEAELKARIAARRSGKR